MIKARVTEAHRTNFTVRVDGRDFTATVRGTFHADGDFPKVGDYVSLTLLDEEKAVIEEVLPRKSVIKRKAADSDEEQIIAANVDLIFIVMGLDGDFNPNRLERYLLLAQQCAVSAVVLLNKVDVVEDMGPYLEAVTPVVGNAPLHLVSATTGQAMEEIKSYFKTDTTAVLLGSSGAGKSTITNWLLQAQTQAVNDIRVDDSRGRHTTTSRQLFTLPSGGYLIDTPGMRELGMVESDADDELLVFERIEALSLQCQFRNCDHEKSQGCAVLEAIESGVISNRELQNYQKLMRERTFQENKESESFNKHTKQNDKRASQRNEVERRRRLSRG